MSGGPVDEKLFDPGAARLPLVSVVIATHSGRAHLERCLPALRATRDVSFETIVVDNGSTDGTLEWLRVTHPWVRSIALPANEGFGHANTVGVEAARAPYVAFLNNDTVVSPDWLRALVDALEGHADVAAVCSALRLLEHSEVVNAHGGGMTWLGFGYDRNLGFPWREGAPSRPPGLEEVLFPTAAAMLMRRQEFTAVGGFDPAFFAYHEDVDLGWRLWLFGRRVVVCHQSIVSHLRGGSSTAGAGDLRGRLGARHAIRSILKNYEPMMAARALMGLLRVWLAAAQYARILDAFAWNVVRLPDTFAERRRVQSRRVLGTSDLIRRGLLSGAWLPPEGPDLPAASRARGCRSWPAGGPVWPGHDSVLGRLGVGWYAKEIVHGRPARRMCGMARVYLHAQPYARGRVVVTAEGPSPCRYVDLTIRCNGAEATEGAAFPATTFALDVTADADGILEVTLLSGTVVLHDVDGRSDWRPVGCTISCVQFVPAQPIARPTPRTVSVVIATFNRWPVLERTLRALASQAWDGDLEVVVVDDGSTDGTYECLQAAAMRKELNLKVLRQDNLKPAIARNAGLLEARGEIVLFIGDDVMPDPDCVARHVARHSAVPWPRAVVGYVDWDRERMRVTPFLEFINGEGPQFGFNHMQDGQHVPYTCFYTANVSVPREVLAGDSFNPNFDCVGWEDTELGYRLSVRGIEIVHDRRASGRHYHPQSLSSFYERQAHAGENAHLLLALQPRLRGTDRMLAAVPAGSALADRLGRLAVPLLDAVDRAGWRVPRCIYWKVVNMAYFGGYARGRPLPPAVVP